jgi:hypothetical protein
MLEITSKRQRGGQIRENSGKTNGNELIIWRLPERANPGGITMATKKGKKPLKKAKKLEATKPLTVRAVGDFGRK